MKKVNWETIGYIALGLIVIGQIVIGWNYMIGQAFFLFGNIATIVRCYAIKQNKADKVKNILLTAMTIGLMIIKLF